MRARPVRSAHAAHPADWTKTRLRRTCGLSRSRRTARPIAPFVPKHPMVRVIKHPTFFRRLTRLPGERRARGGRDGRADHQLGEVPAVAACKANSDGGGPMSEQRTKKTVRPTPAASTEVPTSVGTLRVLPFTLSLLVGVFRSPEEVVSDEELGRRALAEVLRRGDQALTDNEWQRLTPDA